MLAQIMGDTGQVVALDRTAAKVAQVQQLAQDFGLHSITALALDATTLWQQDTFGRRQQQQQQGGKLKRQKQKHGNVEPPALLHHRQPDLTATAGYSAGQDNLTSSGAGSSSSSSSSICGTSDTGGDTSDIGGSTSGSCNAVVVNELAMATDADSSSSSSTASQQAAGYPLAGFGTSSFDFVLLDAPCSALGLRPRLLVDWSLPNLQKLAGYQRALLHSALHVLKPGGYLVYCTCTINPGGQPHHVGRVTAGCQ
jgi:hypothetical protein